jgi:hypothetical protein
MFDADVCLALPPAQGTSGGRPSVQLSDGTVLHANIVIGADGQHSTVRNSVQGKHVKPQAMETVVFTGNIPMKRLLEDDILQADKFAFLCVHWLGPCRAALGGLYFIDMLVGYLYATLPAIHHVLGYPIVSPRKCGSKCPSGHHRT